jgi:predicted dehydrogenase
MIRIAVIGFGYWGPNLARNLFLPGRSRVVSICDLDPARLAVAGERYPGISLTNDASQAIGSADVDAVVIATAVRSHYELARAALGAGKHVLIAKPMTETSVQARALIEEAERRRLTLLVDHTFVYASAVRRMGEIIRAGELGEFYYYDSTRVNLGLFQPDVSVLWDLAIHDLSILDYALDARPLAVSVTGVSHIQGSPENLAYITLFLPQGAIAHINVNWLAPIKLRQTLVGGSRKMIVYDDLQPSEKLRVYDKGVTLSASANEALEARIGYRLGDMTAPLLASREPLANEAEHFLDCIETGAAPITGGAMALRLIELLERATLSMGQRGRLVEVRPASG